MRQFLILMAFVLSSVAPLHAQSVPVQPFAASPSMSDPLLSSQGHWIAMRCGVNGRESVCIYDLVGDVRPRLFSPPDDASVYRFYWASEKHLIIDIAYRVAYAESQTYSMQRGLVLNVETGNEAILMVGVQNVLGANNNVVSLDRDSPNSVVVELVLRNGPEDGAHTTGSRLQRSETITTLYNVNLETGRSRSIERTDSPVIQHVLTPDGEIVARIFYREHQDEYSIVNAGNRTVYEGQHGGRLPRVWGTLDGGAALGMYFSEGPNVGLARLDLANRNLTRVENPVARHSEFGAITDAWSGDFVGFSGYRNNLPDQNFIDPELAEIQSGLTRVLGQHFGVADVQIRLTSWSDDRALISVEASWPGQPAQYFLFERDTNALSPLGSQADGLAGMEIGAVEAVTYTASDGMEIPAFLTLPPGRTRTDGPFALVVMAHGGPAARADVRFNWWVQYYAALGYAVLEPNFRGSSGYGVGFREAGYGEFGGRMIEDSIDGAAWLVEAGVARPDGYCVAGASYGGYAALMSGILDPDHVACIIAVSSVTDPVAMMGEAVSSRNVTAVRYWEQFIGSRYMAAQERAAISPVQRAGEFRAPILMLHGIEDATVSVEQSRMLAREMGDDGRLSYIELDGTDHYFLTTAARTAMLTSTAQFLELNLPPRR